MSSAETLASRHGHELLAVARRSIERGFRAGLPLPIDPHDFPAPLCEPRASFVTLHVDEALRGCIGSAEPCRALVADVAHNAFAAANHDRRFRPLQPSERTRTELHISVLSPIESIEFGSDAELLSALEPRVHGLWITCGARRATFLPQVWAQLPDPKAFLLRLLDKAGIDPGMPREGLRAARYTTDEISGPLVASEPSAAMPA